MKKQTYAANLLAWFHHNGRKTLPWQHPLEPYPVWVSEIMLQQTQVKTVIPYFERFMLRFPTIFELAAAPIDEVLNHWAGLGYYARARNLHKMAKILVAESAGVFPQDLTSLQKLPGLGRSTASAILALCFGQALPILDGNVKRVLSRYLGITGDARLWQAAEKVLPHTDIPAYTQAMMDLGALICTPKNPACLLCPLQQDCVAYQTGRVAEFPAPKPKKAYPTKKTYFLILTDGPHVVLEKRPSPGIWGGLWCLPQYENLDELPGQNYEILGERTHLFTHYRLLFTPVVMKTPALTTGIAFNNLAEYALPAPIKRLLAEIQSVLIAGL